jgi:flagellar protein FlaJ
MKNLLFLGSTKILVGILSIASAIFLVILALCATLGIIKYDSPIDFVVFAILSWTGIYGFYDYLRLKRIRKIDSIFPDFVRDLAESRRAGMTFPKAILFSSKGNYGMLTPEIRRIAQQISWGSSVEEALNAFAKRINTKSIKRTVSLITEASRGGGNVADILDVASSDAREIKMLESERRSSMQPYVIVIYVGMLVFLVIISVLTSVFIPSILGKELVGVGAKLPVEEIVRIFYMATLIQSVGTGVVAGVFEDGKASSSIKHVFILTLLTWITFKFVIGV